MIWMTMLYGCLLLLLFLLIAEAMATQPKKAYNAPIVRQTEKDERKKQKQPPTVNKTNLKKHSGVPTSMTTTNCRLRRQMRKRITAACQTLAQGNKPEHVRERAINFLFSLDKCWHGHYVHASSRVFKGRTPGFCF